MLAQLPGDGEAVLAGQAQVEQDQRRQVVTQCVHQRRAAVQLRHPEAVALQVAGQQPGDVDFVVEHGNMGQGTHCGIVGKQDRPGSVAALSLR